jgi:DNA polymerase-4
MSRTTLQRALGDSAGAHLYNLAHGIDERSVVVTSPSKSVGSEQTYETDLDAREDILRELLRLSDRTATRLRSKRLCARTVTIKVRFSNFRTITRSRTLEEEVDTAGEIFNVARALYSKLDPDRPRIRLLGVSMSGISGGPPRRQGDLLGEGPAQPRNYTDAEKAVDDIRKRFGDESVSHATLMRQRGSR